MYIRRIIFPLNDSAYCCKNIRPVSMEGYNQISTESYLTINVCQFLSIKLNIDIILKVFSRA